jgi:hypothetical protein
MGIVVIISAFGVISKPIGLSKDIIELVSREVIKFLVEMAGKLLRVSQAACRRDRRRSIDDILGLSDRGQNQINILRPPFQGLVCAGMYPLPP